jgi:hypothetical protein
MVALALIYVLWRKAFRLTTEDVTGGFLAAYFTSAHLPSRYHHHRFPAELISHCVLVIFSGPDFGKIGKIGSALGGWV